MGSFVLDSTAGFDSVLEDESASLSVFSEDVSVLVGDATAALLALSLEAKPKPVACVSTLGRIVIHANAATEMRVKMMALVLLAVIFI